MNAQNAYSYDNSSVLNHIEIPIPKSHHFIGKTVLKPRNADSLKKLSLNLKEQGIPKYRFEPVNWDNSVVTHMNNLIKTSLGESATFMFGTLRAEIMKTIKQNIQGIEKEYLVIQKNENIAGIKRMFEESEKEILGKTNIPEKEDCEILSGLKEFKSEGTKYLITADKHFHEYKEIIKEHTNILIVEENNCLALTI